MTLAPEGNTGDYFAQQTRSSSRLEWRETWSVTRSFLGTHNIKLGILLGGTDEHAQLNENSVRIVNTAGTLLETIDFTSGHPFSRSDFESAFFAQDQWSISSHFAINFGVRLEQQEVTGTLHLAPRTGLAFTPFSSGRTILRAGAGVFYDRVPLNVYGFNYYPDQIQTFYNPDGSILSGPTRFFNLTESAAPRHLPLIYRRDVPGDFAPFSINWNVQAEQILTPRVRVKANYLQSRSGKPDHQGSAERSQPDTIAYALSGDGRVRRSSSSRFTGASTLFHETQIFGSFVHSHSTGNLNEFNTYLANFSTGRDSSRCADLSARRRSEWPVFSPGEPCHCRCKFRIMPKVEYRSGFPYSIYNAAREQVCGRAQRAALPELFLARRPHHQGHQVQRQIHRPLRCFRLHNPDRSFQSGQRPRQYRRPGLRRVFW